MAECALSLAEEMYEMAYTEELETAKTKFEGKREPGAEKLKSIASQSLDKKFIYQKLYSSNAVNVMKKAIAHLEYIASRLKNIVEASKVDARLERGVL